MAEVRPAGLDGQEIPVSLVYNQVALAAKYSQQDCKLDSLLDGIQKNIVSTSDDVIQWTYVVPSRIENHLSWRTFLLQPPDTTVRGESEYPLSYTKPGYAWKPGVGVISA